MFDGRRLLNVYVQREVISSRVKRIQREVTLGTTQRHDFFRIIYYVLHIL